MSQRGKPDKVRFRIVGNKRIARLPPVGDRDPHFRQAANIGIPRDNFDAMKGIGYEPISAEHWPALGTLVCWAETSIVLQPTGGFSQLWAPIWVAALLDPSLGYPTNLIPRFRRDRAIQTEIESCQRIGGKDAVAALLDAMEHNNGNETHWK